MVLNLIFKSHRELNLMYVDIDPLYRSHDSTSWEPLLTDYVPKPDELKVLKKSRLLYSGIIEAVK